MSRILVVDDEPVILEVTKRVSEMLGIETALCTDAPGALDVFKAGTFDAVLSDLMLTRSSGLSLMSELLKLRPDLPVAIMTGYATFSHALQAFSGGAFDFLPKPFDPAELKGVLLRLVNFSSRADVPAGARLLGQHAWALREGDTVKTGPGPAFSSLLPAITSVEYQKVGALITRGEALLRMHQEPGGIIHTLWSPLSGRIVENNVSLSGRAGSGLDWLSRIQPTDLESEWGELSASKEC